MSDPSEPEIKNYRCGISARHLSYKLNWKCSLLTVQTISRPYPMGSEESFAEKVSENTGPPLRHRYRHVRQAYVSFYMRDSYI